MDITELILEQHIQQRRLFALLDEVPLDDTATLGALWHLLARFLEVHAKAEEEHFYPLVLQLHADAPGDGDDAEDETVDAVKDHNEIRDAIADAANHEVGSTGWWQAVRDARTANDEHMGEEEHDDLTAFRRVADLQTRHDAAVRFLAFEARHLGGVARTHPDPEQYVREHRPD
ncbi:MAG: hemerythrin domain-containing protein [Jatrophihabitans sp.]|uniref:hemerythrin domain-containing protein n=1 Tax=Jatrophihabitans sp. TaxID=1932789 RepID=UPI003F80FA37